MEVVTRARRGADARPTRWVNCCDCRESFCFRTDVLDRYNLNAPPHQLRRDYVRCAFCACVRWQEQLRKRAKEALS